MSLLEIVGITSTKKTFAIAFVFMARENADHYIWAMRRVKHLCKHRLPDVIVTDRELGLIKALNEVFPTVKHMLCRWHVMCNIELKGRSTNSAARQQEFYNDCFALLESKTEDSYEGRLATMHEKWEAKWGLMAYLESTWLTDHKEALVRAWVDCYPHFGTRTTNM